MSKKTIARRYDTRSYTQDERDQLISHLIAGTQPQRRLFLGKLDNFKDKEEQKLHKKMLKAYLRGAVVFFDGKTTMSREIVNVVYNRETHEKEPVKTGIMEEVPQPLLVRQIYLFK